MKPDLLAAGKKFRRKVAKEFRAALRAARSENERAWPGDVKTARNEILWSVAMKARVTPDEVRGFIHGGKDLPAETIGKMAWALGLKFNPVTFEDDR